MIAMNIYSNEKEKDKHAITITLSRSCDIVFDVDIWFDDLCEDSWFDDELVKSMILDVDQCTVLSPNCLAHKDFGQISPNLLSSGVKALILMLKTDLVIYATNCGDNCVKWIIEISKIKSIKIALGHYMDFKSEDLDIYVEDLDTVYTSSDKLLLDLVEWEGEYIVH